MRQRRASEGREKRRDELPGKDGMGSERVSEHVFGMGCWRKLERAFLCVILAGLAGYSIRKSRQMELGCMG